MGKHVKPTKEELEAQTQAAIKEAEELAKTPEPPKEEEEPDIAAIEKEAGIEKEAEPSKEVKEALKKEVEEKDKKLSASARENQKIYAKNRIINKALVEADETPEPTQEELISEFTDWDGMSEIEQKFAKETVISRNWRKTISEAKDQATKIEKWNDSVDEFVDDPKTYIDTPALEGKAEQFKTFAQEESNNSVPFKTLVGAFLYDQSTGQESNKGAMFERGSGGPNIKPTPKSDKISLEEARKLRTTNYDKWKELNSAGKIDYDL